ncbi:MAG: hypothetical protein LUG46_09335 [Erysipelotrichaceae bacterium]|nr:hypothetical protein [Erysipelotrichaceae bacterium]
MIRVKIADIPFEIENDNPYLRRVFHDYMTDMESLFTISVSEKEIDERINKASHPYDRNIAEANCIFFKLSDMLIDYDAFYFHGAVVSVDNEAYIFTADSGTGKTTHMKNWLETFGDRAFVVNGDKPIIRYMHDQFYACANPLRGKEGYGSNIDVPIKAICLLERSDENKIVKAELSEIINKLFYQLRLYATMIIPKNEEGMNKLYDLIELLIQSVPFYKLQVNTNVESAIVAYEGINYE